MNETWFEALHNRLSSAWDVLTGRAYAGYSVPDDMIEVRLRTALQMMVDEKVDYMTINHLGDPEKQHTIKFARAALAAGKCDG